MFSLRIVTTDHYQAKPLSDLDVKHSEFRCSSVYKVPVIRIYGSTPAGQKTCMHVHGVFPYLYVPYDGTQPWDRYLRLFASSLDKAINIAQGHQSSNIQHVYKITLVSGIPMYGYHDKEEQFLKIYLYNPGIVRKVADLLLGGAVMNQVFQPHESHIPYTLQMFIDYNLYGMNMINLAAVKFRKQHTDDNERRDGNSRENSQDSDISMPRSRPFSLDTPRNTSQRWDDDTITRDMYISATRQSTCELEVDAVAVDIINRLEVDSNVGGNPGLAALWEDEKQRQRDKGQSSQITPQDSQEREDVEITESDGDLQEKFRQIVLELQPYMDSQSDDGSQDGLDEIPPTPASQVELHQSQRDDMSTSSQDTVILDEDKDKVEPVISLESIQRVVSFSQSFHGADSLLSSQPLSDTQDGCLAQALAALADESSPPASQAAAQHVSALEEQDSILHHRSVIPDQKVEQEDEEETLEMSQMIWDEEEEEKSEHGESYDLAGIDDTWNDSQIRTLDDKDDDSEEEDKIPQFDGAADDKKAEKPKSENRPGDRGPVIAGGYNQVDPTNGGGNQPYSGQGHLSYQGQMSQGQIMYGRENYTSGQSGNMSYRGYQPQQQGENYQLNQQLHMQNHQQHHQGYSNKGNEVDNNYMHRNMYRSNNQNWGQTYPNNDPQQQGTGGYDMASWGSYNAGENQDWSNQMSSPQNSMRNENVQSPTPHHHSMLHSPVENLQRMSSSPSNINSPQGILHSPTTAMHSPHSTLPSPDGRLQSPHSNMQSPQPPMQSSQSIQQSLSSPAMSNTGSRTPMASPPLPDVRGNNFEGSNSQGYPSGYQNYNFPGGACKVEYNAQSCAQNTQSGYSYGHRNIQQQYYQTQAGNQSTFNQSAYYHTSQNTYQPDKSHQKNPNAFENRSQMNFAENKSNFKKKLKAKLMEKQLNQKPLSPGHLQSPKFPGNRGIINFPSQTTSNSNAQSSQSKPQHKPPSQLEKLLMADDDDSQTSQDVSHRSLSRCSNTSNTSSSRASEKSQVINNVPAGNGAHSSNSSLSSFSPLSEIIRGNDTVSMKDSTPDKQQSTQFSRTLCQSANGKRNSLNSDSDDLFFDNLSQPNSSNTSMFNDLFNPDNLSPPTFNAQPESIEPGVAACNLNTQVFQRGQLLSPVNQTATHQQTPHPQSQIKGSSFSSLESLENLVSSVQQNSYYGVDVQHHELGDSVGLPSQDLIRSYSKSGDISPSRQNLIDPLRQNQHQLVPIQGNALQNQQDMTSVDHRNICHTNYQHTSASHANELQSYNNWNRPGPYDCLNNEAHHTNNRQFTSNSFYENTANAHPYNWTNTSYETIHSLPPNYDSKMKAQDHMQQYPTLHTQFYQRNHNTPDPSNKNRRSVPKSSNKKSKLTRSLSLPTVPKKRGRPRKCDVNQGIVRNRSNSLVFEKKLLSYNPAYTFAFHVPCPVFKRLKFHQNHPPKDHGIKVVRMHPKDARKYSLMKVGCEIVKAEKLTQKQITGQIESLKQKLASDRDLTTKTTTMLDEKTGVMIAVEINESDDKDSEEGTTSLILDSAEPENSQRTQELQTDSSEDRPDDLSDDRQDNNTSELDTNSFSSIDRTVSKNGKSEADPSLDQISTDLPHDNNMDTHKQFLVDETVSVSLQSENVSRDSVCDQDLSQNYLEGNTSDCNLNSNITNEVQIISAKPVDLSETKHKTRGVLIDETASVSLQSENVSRDSVCDQDLSQDYLEGNTSDCNLNSNIANEAQIISAKPVDLSETKHKTSGVLIDCCLQMKVLNSDDGIAKTANERITNIDDEIKQQTKMSSEGNNGTCMKEEEMVKSENSFQSCTVSKTSAELRSDPFIDKVSANFSPSKDQSCETDLYTEIRSTLLNNIMEKVKFSSNDGETKKTTDFKSIPGKSVGTEIPFTKSSTVDGNLLIKNGENGCLFSIVNKCKAERKKKRRCLSTKKRRQAVFNGHSFPPVVDPDKDELNNIVLKDVNLTEASDGKLTPIRGHTPVAGRSPIRMNYNVEQYRLFDADIISNKDDLEPNLKILHRDLCTSDNHLDKKLKNISMIEKEECSQSCGDSPVSSLISSRTSSRKDSSESTNSGSESWKERWSLRKRKSSSITSDQGSGHRKSLRQRKATLLSYDNSGSDLDCVFEKEDRVKKKKKKKEIAGIDYIVTGRFKGHQSMRVSLDRLDIDTNGIVNAPEFIASRIKQGDLTLQKPVRQYTNIMSVEKGTQDLLRKAQSRTPAFELFTKLQNEAFGDKNGNAGVDDDDDDDKNGNAGVDDDDDDKNGNAGVDDDDDKNGNAGVDDDDDDDDDDVGGGKDIFDVNDDVIEQDENVCEVERNVEDFDEDSNESLKDCQVDDNESDSGSWRGKLSLKKIRNKRGIRKKLTRNQKLQVAFLGKKSRRKKSLGSIGKLLNSLSLLHDATIANLNDSNTTSYNDACKTEDFKVRYDDAMLKMSFLSSSDSDRGGSSPPHPLSPEELARDHQGLTRSTSDVQSPVLSASENSLSPAHHFVPYHQKECSVSDLRLSPIYPFTVTNHKLSSGIFQDCSSDATQPPVLSNQNTAYFLSSNQKKARSSPSLPLFNLANQRKPYKYDISQIYCTQGGIDIKKAQKAVVKLKLLSLKDIELYCGKNGLKHSVGKMLNSNTTKSEISSSSENNFTINVKKCDTIHHNQYFNDRTNSPPDLGPPNIPKYPKSGGYADEPDLPPPLLTHRSPRSQRPDITSYGMFENSFSKSPASCCSSGSLNIVHSDRFSDISDDEDDDEDQGMNVIKDQGSFLGSLQPELLHNDMPALLLENCNPKSLSDSCFHLNGNKELQIDYTGPENVSTENEKNVSLNIPVNRSESAPNHNLNITDMVRDSDKSSDTTSGDGDCFNHCDKLLVSKQRILTPQILPPTCKAVQDTTAGYGLNTAVIQDAYCSNPEDLPEQPRELGGRIFKVQSTRIKDLIEFNGFGHCEGLSSWRNILNSENQIFSTQNENDILMNKLDQEPQLRFALSGDRNIIISPCKPPPTRKEVERWVKGRQLWKHFKKNKNIKTHDEKINIDKNKQELLKEKMELCNRINEDQKKSGESLTSEINDSVNKLYREDADMSVTEVTIDSFYFMDTQVDTEKEQSRFCDSIPIVKNNNDKDEMDGDSSDSNDDVISPSPPSGLRLSQFPIADRCKKLTSQGQHHVAEPTTPLAGNINTTPTATFENITTSTPALMQDIEFKSQRVQKHDNISTVTNTPSVMKRPISLSEGSFHSTPIQRKRLANLFGSAFTPIKSGEKGSADIDSAENLRTSQFAMPRQTPLPRRQSTDSGDSLRRSLQASHLRQFATPANQKGHVSQIDAPTPQNSFGFKVSQQDFKNAKALHEFQNLTVLSMELHAETRVDLRPDPEVDQILAIFYSITNDVSPDKGVRQVMGAIIVDPVSADCQFAQKERLEDSDNEIPLSDSSHLTPSPQPSTSTGQGKRSTPSKARTPSPQPSTSTSQGKRSTPSKARTPSPQPSTSTGQGKRSTPSKARTPSPQPSTSTGQGKRSTPSKARTPSPQPSTSRASRSRTPSPKPSTSKSKKGSEEKGASPRLPVSHKFGADENIPNTVLQRSGIDCDLDVTYVREEAEVFSVFMDVVSRFDPDILVGYEVQNFSWGYLLQRASHLSMPIAAKLSRIPEEKKASHFSAEKDEYGADYASEIHVVGRIILNLWRLLRHEVTLNIYSFENVTYHVLHQRVPHFSFRTLNMWYGHRTHLYRWRVMEYYLTRVKGNLQLIEQLDLIGRTSEFARVFGIEFYDVLSRGSQYRVESMMLRLAKPLNYIPVSPSVHQRARMRAPECIALTLEPESRFYADPVVVVDFQSLYPSIMIAHNYCFSTCLGRLKWLDKAHEGAVEFGCTHVKIPPSVLKKLQNDITVSPNGVVFVKQHIRKGVISAMVEEILNTRIMVKKAMKEHKKDKGLHRLLDARQLGLKLIANVTYGYTGANYSGRMPCIEVGDSIVRKARETLERAIKLVEDTPHWGARVVYGDTDSMFIELKGRSKEEAFKIGYEICDAVTATNPKPMKLKFEKVYLPCILQTKKRYVGFSYETPDQKDPIFDAKGIETVRRDSCSAVSKILEKCIKILFTTRDVSQVKQYVQNQCRKTMEGKVTMQDFIFAKEYRGMSGYKPGACVPALEISRKLLRQDRRAEPRVGERVPYVIVFGPPGLPLIQLVRQPQELLQDPSLRLNATYYITKQILPPLDRIFSLMGVNVFSWYNDMPKFVRVVPQSAIAPESKKGTISHYFSASNCPVCDQQTNQDICNKCMKDPQTVCATLTNRIRHWDKIYMDLKQVCNSCMGVQDNNQPCVSLDCPILFRRLVGKLDTSKGAQLQEILKKTFDV